MVFNSLEYLVFLPVVTILFYIIPKNKRSLLLLVASYYFYMSWNQVYALLILSSTVVTYGGSLLIARGKRRKPVLLTVLLFNLGILAIFKYANFFLDSCYSLGQILGVVSHEISENPWALKILLPVGISFYTFQALSYTLDVYYGKIQAEESFLSYALYVSFFPQLVAGPIERTKNLLPQIKALGVRKDSLKDILKNLEEGIYLILWGLFQKIVIADRIAIYVDEIYHRLDQAMAGEMILATGLFAVQIYCDFNGYTTMARGSAKFLGIDLMKNFRQPYLATSIRDFWKRWHISLTSWFTDYVYIPLGGSRVSVLRHLGNICIVFFISGLWHGAAWHYVLWGLCHGVLQCIEIITTKTSKVNSGLAKDSSKEESKVKLGVLKSIPKLLLTNVMVIITWVFFRVDTIKESGVVLSRIFQGIFHMDLWQAGVPVIPQVVEGSPLTMADWIVLCFAILILICMDILQERVSETLVLRRKITAMPAGVKIVVLTVAIWLIIMFGVYGEAYTSAQFIYFQF